MIDFELQHFDTITTTTELAHYAIAFPKIISWKNQIMECDFEGGGGGGGPLILNSLNICALAQQEQHVPTQQSPQHPPFLNIPEMNLHVKCC